MSAPLVASLSFVEGETPTGYVSRLARAHKTTPRDFCSDLGLDWPSLCSGHRGQIECLAWLTGHDLQRLLLWSAAQLSGKRYQVGKTSASTRVFRRTACRCCPRCVYEARKRLGSQGIFELLEWKVLSLHSCDIHAVQLITLPPAAHSHEAYDFTTQAVQHWRLIEHSAVSGSALPKTAFEDYVRTQIRHGAREDWLSGLDLTHLQGACMHLGAALERIEARAANQVSEREMHRLSELGYTYLRHGPVGLKSALDKLRKNSPSERSLYSSDLGPFYHWLNEVAGDSMLAPLADTTRDHIFEHYPAPLGKEVLGKKPIAEIWLTMEEARKRSGFGAMFLKKLLGYMDGLGEKEALRRTDVKVSELVGVQAFWQQLLNLSQVSEALCLRSDQVKALMRSGVLKQIRVTSTLRYALRDEVTAILKRIEELPYETEMGEFVPVKAFCRDRKVPLAQVVKTLMCADHANRFRRTEGSGIDAVKVAAQTPIMSKEIQLDRDLTLSETARYLKISIVSIRKLRDAGYLNSINKLNPDTNHIKVFITKVSIESFEAGFITLGQMACLRNVAPIHLARELDRCDLFPISCGGTVVRVYDKNAIALENTVKETRQ